MNKPNTQNYKTNTSKISNFTDFEQKKGEELEELEKTKRSFVNNDKEQYNLPNLKKQKYNKVTRKMDTLSKEEIEDRIKSIETERKGKKLEIVEEKNKVFSYEKFLELNSEDFKLEDDFKSNSEIESSNYMFFRNLKTIKDMCEKMSKINELKVSKILEGHDWVEDHVSMSKESISHVYNFLNNEFGNEISENKVYYMLFSNFKSIERMCKNMLDMDESKVDNILSNGHDWADDHISSSKENIQQVYDFFKNNNVI